MNESNILPVLDTAVLQDKANEYAMKGATESMKEFYSGYNSPYRKAIDEELKKQELGYAIKIPDIIAQINETLSVQVDQLANEAIAKTFLPLVKRFLTRAEPELKLSDILKEFIGMFDCKGTDDCELQFERHEKYGWITLRISTDKRDYDLTLHTVYETEKQSVVKYQFLSIPENRYSGGRQTMKLSFDGTTLEMPFTKDILADDFSSYVARLVMAKTRITIDCEEFEYDMFPERCHCD